MSRPESEQGAAVSGRLLHVGRATPEMTGHLLHGVDIVAVIADSETREVIEMKTDGRAYAWSNGAVTIYSVDPEQPWLFIPPHRIVAIVGREHG